MARTEAQGRSVESGLRRSSVPTAWLTFAAAGATLLLAQSSLFLLTAALPLYLRHVGAATARIGLEAGISGLAATICTPVAGPLIDRWGSRRLLLTGAASYLVATLGLLALSGEVPATACRALQGMGAALVLPSALTLAPQFAPSRRGTAIAAMGSLNTVALAIGPPLGLWLYAWRGAPALFWPAAGCAFASLVSGCVLPRAPRTAATRVLLSFDRRWSAPLLANVLTSAYFGGIVAYLPLVLARAGGPNAGIFFTADAVGVLLLRVPSGALVDRFGPRLPEVLGIALTLGGIRALFLPLAVPVLVAAGAATGIGAGLFITAVLVVVANHSDERNRGTAMALASASSSAGIFAGGAVSGLLIGPGGFGAVLLFGAASALAGLPVVLYTRRTPATSQADPAR
jgi:MFS family permease